MSNVMKWPAPRRGTHLLPLLLAAVVEGCVLPYALPPTRMDFGAAHAFRDDEPTAFHFAAGLHTASLGPATIPKSNVVDIGAGFVLDGDREGIRSHGVYGEGSWFFLRGAHARLGAGIRGEALFSGDRWGSGAYARLSGELFTVGSGVGQVDSSDGCGNSIFRWGGVPATGVYVEAGGQHLPDGREAAVATAGLLIRLPAVAGLWFIFPGCGN